MLHLNLLTLGLDHLLSPTCFCATHVKLPTNMAKKNKHFHIIDKYEMSRTKKKMKCQHGPKWDER